MEEQDEQQESMESELDQTLEALPGELHNKILATAHKLKIDESDPTWILLRMTVEAQDAKEWSGKAAAAAGEAADRVRDSIVSLPSAISRGTADGAGQVKQIITDAGLEAGGEVKKAGFEVGTTLLGVFTTEKGKLISAIKSETDNFHSAILGDSEAAKKAVLSTIKSEIARTAGHAVKIEWTKTLVLSVVFIVCLIIGAGGIGYAVKSINDQSCVGKDRHIWENDGKTFCMVQIKETR